MSPIARLPHYDYAAPGWYFVTTVTEGRRRLFGKVFSEGVTLNAMGRLVAQEWESALEARRWISCSACVVMPDHFHALVGWTRVPSGRDGTLGRLMAQFKATTVRRLHRERYLPSWEVVWQRRYWDQVIRDERHFEAVRRYILANPRVAWRRSQVGMSGDGA